MTRFALLTSAAALAVVPAVAQMGSMSSGASGLTGADAIENMIRSSNIEGAEIYAVDRTYTDAEWDIDMFNEVGANWGDVGEVEDIVFSQDFKTVGLVVSTGGFLDIGENNVVLSMDDVRRLNTDDDDMAFVVRMTQSELENLPNVEENWW